jgi:16S rRNA (uracil1498-N3)-methyltransferase
VALQRLIVTPNQFAGDYLTLTPEQQHYLRRVLRLIPGQEFMVLDGQGSQWLATLQGDGGATLTALPNSSDAEVVFPGVTLAAAIPKGSGFDDLVRQATELGVTTLQPLITERTLHRPNAKKLERWRRIAAEATEQSERLWLPRVGSPLTWEEFLRQHQHDRRFLCVARRSASLLLTELQAETCWSGLTGLTLATGPEGGWTPMEIDLGIQAGFHPVSLGPAVLRAVTAPLAALAVTQAVMYHQLWGHTSE